MKSIDELGSRNSLKLISIYEISKILSSSLDLRETLRGVLKILSSYLQMPRAMVSLLQTDGHLQTVAGSGLSQEALARGSFGPGEGITGRILKSGVPMVVPNVADEPLFLNRTGARASLEASESILIAFLGVPIKLDNKVYGVLSVDREWERGRSHNFDADLRFLSMVANLIAQSMKLQELVAQEREGWMQEKHRLQKELQGKYKLDQVVGRSKRMQLVFEEVHQVAPGRATVLLRGESGTGKEVIARAIHYLSPRKEAPFVKLNCAALPESLLESELFGHEKGAFTGATQERKGRFELAHGGTLFLDEIGDISMAFQAKLLRVLQEREFERVGGTRTHRVDVRLITATNRNLEEAVAKGAYRADLYYRINVVAIFLPPLRERREDIPLLVEHFLQRFRQESGRKLILSPEAMQTLVNCVWPGNVRELENCVERVATMTQGTLIRDGDLACRKHQCFSSVLWKYQQEQGMPITQLPPDGAVRKPPESLTDAVLDDPGEAAPEAPRERLVWAMEQCGWVQAKAARLLGLSPRQIAYALQKYKIPLKRL